jgi:phospholipid transport system substrate-binding protein
MQATKFSVVVALCLTATLTVPLARAAAPSGDDSPVSALAGQVDASGPHQLVQTAANVILKALDEHRAEYRQDPAKLRALVDGVLLPHFDTELAARQVLARHWNAATPQQREHFITAFINSMFKNYGNALLDFTANRMRVLPYRGPANTRYATVATQVRKNDGSLVQVNYALDHTDQGWKVWDVVIEGVSYVKSFQQDLGEQIDHQGIDAVIARLEQGETPAAIQKTRG